MNVGPTSAPASDESRRPVSESGGESSRGSNSDSRREADELGRLLQAMRDLQARFVDAVPPPEKVTDLVARIEAITAEIAPWQQNDVHSLWENRRNTRRRGSLLTPPYVDEAAAPGEVRGSVRFSRFYHGAGGVVHGGSIPLVFDEVMGRVTNQEGLARTAYLHVNYRKVTMLEVEHRYEGRIDRIDGRKLYATARLLDPEGDVTADAEGLFIMLRPGQP